MEKFISEQIERAKQMKDEMNHLVEYHSVLRKVGSMIFGQGEVQANSLHISKREAPEDLLLGVQRAGGSGTESDGSDDQLFSANESKPTHLMCQR